MRTPPGRYDEPRSLPRPVLGALAALALLAVTVGAFFAFHRSREGTVDHVLIAYDVQGTRAITVTFEARKKAADSVLCVVEALGDDGGVVGRREVRFGPDADRRTTITLATKARAYTGVVRGCRVEQPSP